MANQSHIGLDIGPSSIKAVQLEKKQDKHFLLNLGMEEIPRGIFNSESKEDIKKLGEILKNFIKEHKFTSRNVAAALPESLVFTRVIDMPVLSEKELASSIRWEAEQQIPLPLEEVIFDYQILSKWEKNDEAGKMTVLLVACPKKVSERHLEILRIANLEPVAIETEIIAVSRSLVENNPYSPVSMVINLGSETTDISVIKKGILSFTRSIGTGGNAIARAVATTFGLETQQAEEYKKSYGLDETKLEGRVVEAIKPVFDIIIGEIKRGLLYYQSKDSKAAVKRVVLCGGTARLPGLVVYLANKLSLEVQIGDPWFNIEKGQLGTTELMEEGPLFAAAVGLALKKI